MEPGGLLRHSQEIANHPYAESGQWALWTLSSCFNIMTLHATVSQEASSFGFPHQKLYLPLLSSLSSTCLAQLILLDLITPVFGH